MRYPVSASVLKNIIQSGEDSSMSKQLAGKVAIATGAAGDLDT
jgi:hypothetical protein